VSGAQIAIIDAVMNFAVAIFVFFWLFNTELLAVLIIIGG
jgi:hypothetical protein